MALAEGRPAPGDTDAEGKTVARPAGEDWTFGSARDVAVATDAFAFEERYGWTKRLQHNEPCAAGARWTA
jgi:hypothetical protein